jgi:hypothetical protein
MILQYFAHLVVLIILKSQSLQGLEFAENSLKLGEGRMADSGLTLMLS